MLKRRKVTINLFAKNTPKGTYVKGQFYNNLYNEQDQTKKAADFMKKKNYPFQMLIDLAEQQ